MIIFKTLLGTKCMGVKINCECTKCKCQGKFETVETEDLINLIQHGRLTQEQISFLNTRIGSRICKQCFRDNHYK